jgi:catechol 2,3-dioxygenase-like lactoylglutathione lyase family enzyme
MQHLTLDHFVLVAGDVEATLAFYAGVLGADVRDHEAWRSGRAEYPVLHFGGWKVNVHPAGADIELVAPEARPGTVDACFVWPGPIAEAQRHLADHGVELELGPIRQEGAAGAGASIYFRDPDGNLLELISYDQASVRDAVAYP